MNDLDRTLAGLSGRAWDASRAAMASCGLTPPRPAPEVMSAAERDAWAQYDYDYQRGATPELRAYRAELEGVTEWHDARHVRWLKAREYRSAYLSAVWERDVAPVLNPSSVKDAA